MGRKQWLQFYFFVFMFSGFTSGCASNSDFLQTPKVTLQKSSPVNPSARIKTMVAVNFPTPSLTQESMLIIQPTITKEVEINRMQMECVKEINYAPENLDLNGILAIQSTEGSFLLDLRTGEIIQLIDGLMSKAVSPNGYLVAVEALSSPNIDIFDSFGNLITSLNLSQEYERYWFNAWFDNENVLLDAKPLIGEKLPNYAAVVYNVFTGEKKLFVPDYPGISTEDRSVGQFWYAWARLVLDPTLSYLVYPTSNYDVTDLGDYVLWDIEAGQEIARLYMFLRDASEPVWSPSGDRFVVEARLNLIDYEVGSEMNKPLNANDVPTDYGGYELFTMDLTGETRRLTYLNQTTRWIDFADYVWSPDGSKIATWMYHPGGSFLEGDELAILDVETGELINYCILGGGPIYWSQDGNYLAIGSVPPKDENSPIYYTNNVAVINWKEGWFVELYEDAHPAGWMVNMP